MRLPTQAQRMCERETAEIISISLFEARMNPQGWLPPCRPDGLRWQGKVQMPGRRESAVMRGTEIIPY